MDVVLIAAGAVLLVGTIVADFFTAGGSLADDPVTVPAALTMIGTGLGLGAATLSGGEPVQPKL